MNLIFESIVVELQLHVEVYFKIKEAAHPAYEVCRSLGLIGCLAAEVPDGQSRVPRWSIVGCTMFALGRMDSDLSILLKAGKKPQCQCKH